MPGKLEKFLNGEVTLNSPGKLFAAAILMAIPALMIFLSATVTPKINRLLNIVFGVIYTCLMVLIAATSISLWWTFYVFLAITESIITSMIVWYAWKCPRVPADG